MTPLLTPLDSPVFDDDVIADMESHIDEVIPCRLTDAAATFRISMRCCGDAAFFCARHRAYIRYQVEVILLLSGMVVACTGCRHEFWDATGIDDIVREVQL